MRPDAHPRSMAIIATAIGIFAIGVILTIAFWDRDALLGVGITMAVIGIGIVLLGCIHLQAQRRPAGVVGGDRTEKSNKPWGPAPERIPPPHDLTYKDGAPVPTGDSDGENDGPLVYDEFSASPSPDRVIRLEDGTVLGDGQQQEMGFSPPGAKDGMSVNAAGNVVPAGSAFVSVTPVTDGTARRLQAQGGPLFPLSPFDQRSFPVPEAVAGGTKAGHAMSGARPSGRSSSYMDHAADMAGTVRHSGGDGYYGGSPLAMGSDTENSPPPPSGRISGVLPSDSNGVGGAPSAATRPLPHGQVRLPAHSNAPYTTTTTTTVHGSEMRHRTSTRHSAMYADSPPPPQRELASGYDPTAHGYTDQELDAEISRHRDERYEAHLRALEENGHDFNTPQGDDDRLPDTYWRGSNPPSAARKRE